jgi:hypothetical protein
MKPTRLWIGLVFVGLGLFGILDAVGALEWDSTIGNWWPMAVIGYGIADMLADRRITVAGVVITGIGIALLIDEQSWTGEDAVWSVLLLVIGTAILIGGSHRHKSDHDSFEEGPAIKPSEHALR